MVEEGELLWTPDKAFIERSNMKQFMDWLARERGKTFDDYDSLWRWSVDDLEGFWGAIWDYFGIISTTPYERVLDREVMPGARWFEGARVNYAEHMLRHEQVDPDGAAVFHLSELRPLEKMSWREVGGQARLLATRLRELGVGPGDRVVSYMPNIPETMIAMIATTAVGAIWSSAAPEFGVTTVLDRFTQIEPKVMFAVDGYRFGGKDFDRSGDVARIAAGLPSLEKVIWFNYLDADKAPPAGLPGLTRLEALMDGDPVPAGDFSFERVAHDHPLWILFSSGTTGLPKAIVHSHVGILLEIYLTGRMHLNLNPGKSQFFYSTTGWMMWNTLVSTLLQGATAVLYDGHPAHPSPDLLWKLAADTGATCFGASPTFVLNMEKAGIVPKDTFDLSRLEVILLAGSPATPETFAWFYENVKQDLWLTSQSGGTEFCSGLVGATPLLPVRAGEIQARVLGKDVHAWDEQGNELVGEVGELVVTRPMPSMPLHLWNDADGSRYLDAYFDMFPGVWRHGDFIKINERGGCYIYGRSDSTLNRFGVRIGTAEIYRTLDQIAEIADSIIVCLTLPGGRFYMPLFVKLKEDATLDDALKEKIVRRLREEASPRHVPDDIFQVPEVPYTLTGKKMEVPVTRVLAGKDPDTAASRGAMRDPAAFDWFVRFAKEMPVLERAR